MSGGRTKPADSSTEKGMRTAQRNTENNSIEIANLKDKNESLESTIAGKLQWAGVPAAPTSPGNPGQIAYASGYLYICIERKTWQRVAIATWTP